MKNPYDDCMTWKIFEYTEKSTFKKYSMIKNWIAMN